MYGFYRIALGVPVTTVADPAANAGEIISLIKEAEAAQCAVLLCPELSVTGSTCGDLFASRPLLDAAEAAVAKIAAATVELKVTAVIGVPVAVTGSLCNTAVIIQHGKIMGIVPAENISRCRGAAFNRLFVPGSSVPCRSIDFAGMREIPFGGDLLFGCGSEMLFGVEIGSDAAMPISPGCIAASAGASVILNPASGAEVIGSAGFRRSHLCHRSALHTAVWATVTAGTGESTTSGAAAGHAAAAECGKLLLDGERFCRESKLHTVDIDLARVNSLRLTGDHGSALPCPLPEFRRITLDPLNDISDYRARIERTPFVPEDPAELAERCREVINIQSSALAKRITHTGAKGIVLGISGGLDSTLALLAGVRTLQLLQRPTAELTAVTMPGFGTSGRTYNNAVELCRLLQVTLREIPVREASLQHFRDIGHDPENRNVVYENTQARERTQILLDLANSLGGIAIGTGDLSECALGWCTFNGDHIAMYGVNSSVPKTLMRHIIAHIGREYGGRISEVLQDIIDTPVSPELLPAGADGSIGQRTEEIIGPYEVHDFFLWHFLKYGSEPEKILYLAAIAFAGEHSREELAGYLRIFLRRFITQQFKRNCSPDAPKVGTISLSPHGDLLMPSDAAVTVWLEGYGS